MVGKAEHRVISVQEGQLEIERKVPLLFAQLLATSPRLRLPRADRRAEESDRGNARQSGKQRSS
jgi:hypothetical protein